MNANATVKKCQEAVCKAFHLFEKTPRGAGEPAQPDLRALRPMKFDGSGLGCNNERSTSISVKSLAKCDLSVRAYQISNFP